MPPPVRASSPITKPAAPCFRQTRLISICDVSTVTVVPSAYFAIAPPLRRIPHLLPALLVQPIERRMPLLARRQVAVRPGRQRLHDARHRLPRLRRVLAPEVGAHAPALDPRHRLPLFPVSERHRRGLP